MKHIVLKLRIIHILLWIGAYIPFCNFLIMPALRYMSKVMTNTFSTQEYKA